MISENQLFSFGMLTGMLGVGVESISDVTLTDSFGLIRIVDNKSWLLS